MITVRVVDLFAGCGGLTRGFHDVAMDQDLGVRFEVVAAVEADQAAAATYAANFGRDRLRHLKIEDWREGDIPAGSSDGTPGAEVVVGGPPCQGFSTLGAQDPDDPRNTLWREYVRVLRVIRPYYFVLENVAAFLASPQWVNLRAETVDGGLSDYHVEGHILNAAEFGVPQVRKRAVIIGRRRDRPPFPMPVGSLANRPGEWTTVRQALSPLDERVVARDLPREWFPFENESIPGAFKTSQIHLTRKLTPLSMDRFRHIPYGGNRRNLPRHLLAPCWVNHTTGSLDVMGRLRWEQPSVTIRTEFVKPEKGRYLHPVQDRPITPAEAALLQTFPMDYLWCGAKVHIARQIGNAVPVRLAHELGRAVAAQFV